MQLGEWHLTTVSGGNLRLDGGTMFGVVPKMLWQKKQPADEFNRIRSATNCVLARSGRQTVLIDTGYGGKATEKERQRGALENGDPLLASLQEVGVSPETIDLVVLTHLHFDHAGGGTRYDTAGKLVTSFPNAHYVVQRGEWQVATSGITELRAAYPQEHLLPLAESSQLELIEGDVEILPGLRSLVTGGHTEWHQALILESNGLAAIYLGDLCPMAAHMKSLWGMSYDLYPLETRRRKPQVLGLTADNQWLALWDHDPDMAAARIARDAREEFVVTEAIERL